jgi:hypothetical protein
MVLSIRAFISAKLLSIAGRLGTSTPAARPAPKACSLACRTWRAKVNMSG